MEARQLSLFDPAAKPAIQPCDPHILVEDVPRVGSQNALILELLERGPQTNRVLANVSLKYTSRVSDLRAAGYDIVCHRVEQGLTIYTLKPPESRQRR